MSPTTTVLPSATKPPALSALRSITLDPGQPVDLRDREVWGTTPWPEWVKGFREPQWEAICGAWEAYQSGKRWVFIDAPTGTGKTLVGEAMRRLIAAHRSLYVCSTKTLQDQFAHDFSAYAKVLKGRSNYPTGDHPDKFDLPYYARLTAEDCLHRREFLPVPDCDTCLRTNVQPLIDSAGVELDAPHCNYCHPVAKSPYLTAKQAVIEARLGVINTAYLLTEGNTPRAQVSKAAFIIADESDMLESVLMGYESVKISKRLRAQLGIAMPRLKTKEEAWGEWCDEEALPKILAELSKHPAPDQCRDSKQAKHVMGLTTIASGLQKLSRGLAEGEKGNWVYCTDTETEALTRRGWVKYDEITTEDEVLGFDPVTRTTNWEQVQRVNIFDYEGEMVQWSGRRMNSLTTPNHRWMFTNDEDEIEFRTSADLGMDYRWSRVLVGGGAPLGFREVALHDDELVEAVAWYVTEGYDHPQGGVQVSQSLRVNPGYVDRIESVNKYFTKQGLKVTRTDLPDRGMVRWYWGVKIGRLLQTVAPKKSITPQFLCSLTERQARMFLETLIDADGHRRGSTYWTQQCSERIAGFQMLAGMLGYRTTTHVASGNCQTITILSTTVVDAKPQVISRGLVKRVPYAGKVWCPTVRTGTWFARREGITYFTGNTGYEKQDKNDHDIEFKPVRVDQLAPLHLWPHGGRWLLMSATLIDPKEQVSSLGIPTDEWEVVTVAGGFPKARRPVVVLPVADMSRRAQMERPDTVEVMAKKVAEIIDAHPDDRVLIHTVSYDLTNKMLDLVGGMCKGRPMLSYTNSSEREPTLNKFKQTEKAVVFAPSFDRGVDLPGDLCRVQVILKMPFASLGDKQVARRMYSKDGQLWYSVSTIRVLVQMTGRAMRSSDDWCTTYILDRQFVSNVWKKNARLLPKWWSEALRWDGRIAPPIK